MRALLLFLMLSVLGLPIMTGCLPNSAEPRVMPTLAVLPTLDPRLDSASAPAVPTASPPTAVADSAMQSGVDTLFTQTAQAQAQLAPTETLIAIFNDLLTSTAAAYGTQQAVASATSEAQLQQTQAQIAAQTAEAIANATATARSALRIITPDNISQLQPLLALNNVHLLELSPYAPIMVNGGPVPALWDLNTLQPIPVPVPWQPTAYPVTDDIDFSGRANQFALAAGSTTYVYTFDMATNNVSLLFQLDDAESSVTAIKFDPENERLVTLNSAKEILVWDLTDGSLDRTFGLQRGTDDWMNFSFDFSLSLGSEDWVTFAPEPDVIYVKTDTALEAWNIATGTQDTTRGMSGSSDLQVAFSPSGTLLAYVGSILIAANTREPAVVINGVGNLSQRVIRLAADDRVTTIAMDPGDTIVALGLADLGVRRGDDPGVRFYSIPTTAEIFVLPVEPRDMSVNYIQFNQDRTLLTVSTQNNAYLYGIRGE